MSSELDGSSSNTIHEFRRQVDTLLTRSVILEPKDPKPLKTRVDVEKAAYLIDRHATVTNDPRSANFWIVASTLEAATRFTEEENILQEFKRRKVVLIPGSKEPGEVSRLREFVGKNIVGTAKATTSTTSRKAPRRSPRDSQEGQIIYTTPWRQPCQILTPVPLPRRTLVATPHLTQPLPPQLPQSPEPSENEVQTPLPSTYDVNFEPAKLYLDAAVDRASPSPSTSSESSQSDVFYSAMSSFVDDLVPQFAESDSASRNTDTSSETKFQAETTKLKSSTRISPLESKPALRDLDSSLQLLPQSLGALGPTPPPNKKAKLGRNPSAEKASTSPQTDLSLSGPKLAYQLLNVTPSQRIHPHKSFHDLSPESQKVIFQFILPTVPRVHEIKPGYTSRSIALYYGQIYSLIKVCRRWKRTIEALPKLWTHVANVIPLDVVDTYLARSKNEGVEIVLFAGTAGLEPTDEELDQFRKFINMVESNRQRWMSLVVMDFPAGKGNYLLCDLFDVPARPAPGLTEVYVGTRNNAPLSTWKPLSFKNAAPNLRVLCVHGVTPDLGDYAFARQLERLHIVDPSWVNTIHLIGVLARNHTIRDLKLVNIKFAIGEERLKQDIEVFDLPRLESFSLSTLDTSAEFGQLFTRLNAPNCMEYDIAVDLDQLKSSKIQSSGAMTTFEWNLLGFGLQPFLDTLRNRAAYKFVYPEGERQWFDWQDNPSAAPIFEWRSGSFADGVVGKGASFRIRFRTKDCEGVYEWVDIVQKQADELRMGRKGSRGL